MRKPPCSRSASSSASRVGDGRAHFPRHAQNAGRREHALDIELVVRRDPRRIEAGERLTIGVPLVGDLLPAHAGLEDGPRHHFEVIGHRARGDNLGNRCQGAARSLRPGDAASLPGPGRDRHRQGRRSRTTMLLSSRGRILGFLRFRSPHRRQSLRSSSFSCT